MTTGASPTRPLSPHLQIWRFTVTMAASITHRATGAILYGGALLLAAWLFAAASNPEAYAAVSAIIHSAIGVIVIAGYVWALMFHAMNGLRHLYWDSGRGLAPKTAKITSWLVYAGSFLVTAIILWAGYAANGGA